MSHYPQGEIRPNHTPTDLYFLNKALTGCDAVAALIENAVAHPENVTIECLVILADGLRQAADTLDPRLVRTVGGRHHG
jgi:hypothetical protein